MISDFYQNLIPYPRSLRLKPGTSAGPRRVTFVTRNLCGTDAKVCIALFRAVLKQWTNGAGGRGVEIEVNLQPDYSFPGTERVAKELLLEGYELVVGKKIALTAREPAGILRGVQTMRQVLENADASGKLRHCRIVDWPRVAMRGIHYDMARETEYRPAFMKKVVERVAYFKMNTLHLYLENKFLFPSSPGTAPPGAMTTKEARALCRHAEAIGVTIIPQISTMGHMEAFLHGPYAGLREDPGSSFNICPTHRKTRPFLAGHIADVAAAFRAPYIHVGYDESHSGVCKRCREHGTPQDILADHLNWLNAEVKKHGARTMCYGDRFLSRAAFPRTDAANGGTPEQAAAALSRVDRDIVITDWHYTAPYGRTVRRFVEEGFEVHIASGSNLYWHDSMPLARGAHWIVPTIDNGIEDGALGAFNTNWEYYRGQFFDNFWYFNALAAERQWTDRPHDYAAFLNRFTNRFWGVSGEPFWELVSLAEATPLRRRPNLLDAHVLIPDDRGFSRQASFDFPEVGKHIIEQAVAFRKAARRNIDTLRMLDVPGQAIRYLGARMCQKRLLELALDAGDKQQAIAALQSVQNAASVFAGRLEDGYKVYGSAVVDRKRISKHIDQIKAMIRLIRNSSAGALKRMTTEKLVKESDLNILS